MFQKKNTGKEGKKKGERKKAGRKKKGHGGSGKINHDFYYFS